MKPLTSPPLREMIHQPLGVTERLTDGIALVVVPAAGEHEKLGFEVGQPRCPFGQQGLARFELCGGDRHPAHIVALWLYGDDSRKRFLAAPERAMSRRRRPQPKRAVRSIVWRGSARLFSERGNRITRTLHNQADAIFQLATQELPRLSSK